MAKIVSIRKIYDPLWPFQRKNTALQKIPILGIKIPQLLKIPEIWRNLESREQTIPKPEDENPESGGFCGNPGKISKIPVFSAFFVFETRNFIEIFKSRTRLPTVDFEIFTEFPNSHPNLKDLKVKSPGSKPPGSRFELWL